MIKEREGRLKTRIIEQDDPQAVGLAVWTIAAGKIVAAKIWPMYGFFVNGNNLDTLTKVWRLKERTWVDKAVSLEEEIHKPANAITKKRFIDLVDWSVLNCSASDPRIEAILNTGIHTVFPVKDDVPDHLIVYHSDVRTMSMVVVDENFPFLGPLVYQLEESNPDVIVSGSSANRQGESVTLDFDGLIAFLGDGADLIIKGQDFRSEPDQVYQLAQAFVLPSDRGMMILLKREGIGANELRQGLSHFNIAI